MYKFRKINGELTMEHVAINFHPSIIQDGKKEFSAKFSREMARHDIAKYWILSKNGKATDEDKNKMDMLKNAYFENEDMRGILSGSDFSDVSENTKKLFALTLIAHGALFTGVEYDVDSEKYKFSNYGSLDLSATTELYKACVMDMKKFEHGSIDIDTFADDICKLYNNATSIINHDSEENVCKKWTQETRKSHTYRFINGLHSDYTITAENNIKENQKILKSKANFDKYFAMWLCTNGRIQTKEQKVKKTVDITDLISDLI